MIMYSSVLPGHGDRGAGAGDSERVVDADDPANRNLVRELMFGES